ncbi:MAG: PKD domain-containing protein [Bacteriovoracaceae bacterium]
MNVVRLLKNGSLLLLCLTLASCLGKGKVSGGISSAASSAVSVLPGSSSNSNSGSSSSSASSVVIDLTSQSTVESSVLKAILDTSIEEYDLLIDNLNTQVTDLNSVLTSNTVVNGLTCVQKKALGLVSSCGSFIFKRTYINFVKVFSLVSDAHAADYVDRGLFSCNPGDDFNKLDYATEQVPLAATLNGTDCGSDGVTQTCAEAFCQYINAKKNLNVIKENKAVKLAFPNVVSTSITTAEYNQMAKYIRENTTTVSNTSSSSTSTDTIFKAIFQAVNKISFIDAAVNTIDANLASLLGLIGYLDLDLMDSNDGRTDVLPSSVDVQYVYSDKNKNKLYKDTYNENKGKVFGTKINKDFYTVANSSVRNKADSIFRAPEAGNDANSVIFSLNEEGICQLAISTGNGTTFSDDLTICKKSLKGIIGRIKVIQNSKLKKVNVTYEYRDDATVTINNSTGEITYNEGVGTLKTLKVTTIPYDNQKLSIAAQFDLADLTLLVQRLLIDYQTIFVAQGGSNTDPTYTTVTHVRDFLDRAKLYGNFEIGDKVIDTQKATDITNSQLSSMLYISVLEGTPITDDSNPYSCNKPEMNYSFLGLSGKRGLDDSDYVTSYTDGCDKPLQRGIRIMLPEDMSMSEFNVVNRSSSTCGANNSCVTLESGLPDTAIKLVVAPAKEILALQHIRQDNNGNIDHTMGDEAPIAGFAPVTVFAGTEYEREVLCSSNVCYEDMVKLNVPYSVFDFPPYKFFTKDFLIFDIPLNEYKDSFSFRKLRGQDGTDNTYLNIFKTDNGVSNELAYIHLLPPTKGLDVNFDIEPIIPGSGQNKQTLPVKIKTERADGSLTDSANGGKLFVDLSFDSLPGDWQDDIEAVADNTANQNLPLTDGWVRGSASFTDGFRIRMATNDDRNEGCSNGDIRLMENPTTVPDLFVQYKLFAVGMGTMTLPERNLASTTSKCILTEGAPTQMVADITPDFTYSCNGYTCDFTPSVTNLASGETVTSYAWNFGDTNTDSTMAPSYTYLSSGSYTVTLTITTSEGNVRTKTQTNTLAAIPPTIDFSYTCTPNGSNFDCTFTPILPSGVSITYDYPSVSFTFGDGNNSSSYGPTATNSYIAAGTYTVDLVIITSDYLTSTVSKSVVVQ